MTSFRSLFFCVVFATLFFSCSNHDDPEFNEPSSSGNILLNFTSDYASGELRWYNDMASPVISNSAFSFYQDSKIAAFGETIYVLERMGADNISCIPAKSLGDEKSIKQISLEDGSNPQGIAVTGGKGYITLHSEDYLQIINPVSCALEGKINLPIKNSYASAIIASGDTLLVAMQRLEAMGGGLIATKPGLLARINAKTGSLIDTIKMNYYNPHSMLLSKGKLYIASIRYNPPLGITVDTEKCGIEALDLATGEFETIYNGEAGVSEMSLDEENGIIYASFYIEYGSSPLVPITIADKKVGTKLPNISDAYSGSVYDPETKQLFIADRAGLKVYDPATKKTQALESKGILPPYSLAIVR
jgi:DNA-binding beta-propeller fold protein YncE